MRAGAAQEGALCRPADGLGTGGWAAQCSAAHGPAPSRHCVPVPRLPTFMRHLSDAPSSSPQALAKGRPDDGWPGINDKQVPHCCILMPKTAADPGGGGCTTRQRWRPGGPAAAVPLSSCGVAMLPARLQVPLRDDQTYIPGLLNSQGTKVGKGAGGKSSIQAGMQGFYRQAAPRTGLQARVPAPLPWHGSYLSSRCASHSRQRCSSFGWAARPPPRQARGGGENVPGARVGHPAKLAPLLARWKPCCTAPKLCSAPLAAHRPARITEGTLWIHHQDRGPAHRRAGGVLE